jgi:hypothetical protein
MRVMEHNKRKEGRKYRKRERKNEYKNVAMKNIP